MPIVWSAVKKSLRRFPHALRLLKNGLAALRRHGVRGSGQKMRDSSGARFRSPPVGDVHTSRISATTESETHHAMDLDEPEVQQHDDRGHRQPVAKNREGPRISGFRS
jgi:hypothetical protein